MGATVSRRKKQTYSPELEQAILASSSLTSRPLVVQTSRNSLGLLPLERPLNKIGFIEDWVDKHYICENGDIKPREHETWRNFQELPRRLVTEIAKKMDTVEFVRMLRTCRSVNKLVESVRHTFYKNVHKELAFHRTTIQIHRRDVSRRYSYRFFKFVSITFDGFRDEPKTVLEYLELLKNMRAETVCFQSSSPLVPQVLEHFKAAVYEFSTQVNCWGQGELPSRMIIRGTLLSTVIANDAITLFTRKSGNFESLHLSFFYTQSPREKIDILDTIEFSMETMARLKTTQQISFSPIPSNYIWPSNFRRNRMILYEGKWHREQGGGTFKILFMKTELSVAAGIHSNDLLCIYYSSDKSDFLKTLSDSAPLEHEDFLKTLDPKLKNILEEVFK